MIITIGLTGGIATGKSTASKFLQELGCTIIDGDVIAREVVREPEVLEKIERVFGEEVLDDKGKLRRKKLGDKVFNDERALRKLNEITHPAIRKRIRDRLEEIKNAKGEEEAFHCIVIDGALLIEMNLQLWVDEVWVVSVSTKDQINRLMARDRVGEEDAKKRIEAQMTTEKKMQYADVVLDNTGSQADLKEQIKNEFYRLRHQ